MEGIGQAVFYVAIVVGSVSAAIYLLLLGRTVVTSIRFGSARRPMLANYAGLAFGLTIPVMVVGIVLWGRLPWWFVLLFVPGVAARLAFFKIGRSLSRRRD